MNTHSTTAAVSFLESWLAFQFSQVDLPGLSITVSVDDKIVLSQTYGFANVSTRKKLTTEHRFAVGSQSKMFTSIAILQLAEAGKLSLDDAAAKHLTMLSGHIDERARTMTIRQLLSHTSGLIREGGEADYWQQNIPFPTRKQLEKQMLAAAFPPVAAKHAKYSNLGIAIIGQVIERVSGTTYDDYVTKHVLSKLDLKYTTASQTIGRTTPIATGYTPRHFHQRHPLHFRGNMNAFASVIGVVSTSEDMCHFITRALGTRAVLSRQSADEMQAEQGTIDAGYDEGTSLGLGIERLSVGEQTIVGHSGHLFGQNTATFFNAQTKCAVSIATNCRDGFAKQIVIGVFEILEFFRLHAAVPTPQHLQRFARRVMNTYTSVEIIPTAEKIIAIDPNDWQPFGWADSLEYVDPTTLRIVTQGSLFNEGELVRFNFRDDDDKDDKLVSLNFAGITLAPVPKR